MKKTLKLIMLVSAMIFAMSVPAFALTEGDWEFQLLDNEVMITGYLGTDTDIVIPDEIYGCPVTAVETDSSKSLINAESIVFPKHLKSLYTLVVGNGSYRSKTLEKVVLPEGLEKIENSVFLDCEKLKEINIPSTVTEIDYNAFNGCKSLKEIKIPENIKKIGFAAFANSGIEEIYLPYVEDLDGDVFAGCKNLKKATLAEGNKKLPSYINGMFAECTSLSEVNLPDTIEIIVSGAFDNCASLKEIILPVSLKEIHSAFGGTSISEIVVPYGTEKILGNAFGDNDSLKSVYIPDTVKEMNWQMLEGSNNAIIYCTADSYAAEFCKKNKISYLTDNSVNSGITVLYNGTRISFHSYGQNPELLNSRTLVPLRSIFEAMGAEVEWDGNTKTAIAKRDGVTVKIQIGANEMYKGNEKIAVDVPATILNDRTMVPARVIAEAFGADVQWNANGRTVLINE